MDFIRSLRKSECANTLKDTANKKNKRNSVSPHQRPSSSSKYSTPRKNHESPVQIIRQNTPFMKFHQNNDNIVHIVKYTSESGIHHLKLLKSCFQINEGLLLPLYPAKNSEEIDEMIKNEDIRAFFKENEGQTFCLNNFVRIRGKWEYHFRRADLLEKMMVSERTKSYGNVNLDLTNVKENQDEHQPPSPSFSLLSLRRLSRSLQKDPAPPLSSLQEKIKQLEQSKTLLTPPPSALSSSFPPLPSSLPLHPSPSPSRSPPSSSIPPASTLPPSSYPPPPSPLSSNTKELFLGFLGKTGFFEKETKIEIKTEVLDLVKGFIKYGEEYLVKEEERKLKMKNFDNIKKETGSTVCLKRKKEDDLNDEREWLQQKFRTMEKEKKAKLF